MFLVECKCWKDHVPKNTIHAFRTVVDDNGANWGLLISSAGFQVGAKEASLFTNLRLLDWQGFCDLFRDRWISHYLGPHLYSLADPLVEYTEPVNSRIFRKAEALTPDRQHRFKELRGMYAPLAFAAMVICLRPTFGVGPDLELPILGPQLGLDYSPDTPAIPEDVLASADLRQFADRLGNHLQRATSLFDDVFSERA